MVELKKNLILIVILFIGIILRFSYLDRIPVGIGGDELTYALTTKAMTVSGTDLTGTWNPWTAFMFQYPPGQQQSELPYFLHFPSLLGLPLNLFSTRVSNALLGVATIFLLYLIAKKLWNKNIGLIAAAIAAINPWFIYNARTMYEMTPSVFFILLGWYVLLVSSGKKILLAVPIFVLAFYTYIAMKLLIVPFVLVTLVYLHWSNKNKTNSIYYLWTGIGIIIFVCLYATIIFSNPHASRISEILTPNSRELQESVDGIRKVSIRNGLVDMFENKYVLWAKIVASKIVKSFSSELLFVKGDLFFSIYNHGLMYVVDCIFLVLGLMSVWAQKKSQAIYLLTLLVVVTISHAIHSASLEDFTPHLAMVTPILILFISYGIHELVVLTKGFRPIVASVLIGVYVLSLGNFVQIYFYQFPIQGNFNFPFRVLARYITLTQDKTGVIVHTQQAQDIFKKYLFYSDSIQRSTMGAIAKATKGDTIHFKNIELSGCTDSVVVPTGTVVAVDAGCDSSVSPGAIKIPMLKDGGSAFYIYGDTLCSTFALKPYPSLFTMKQLAVEHLSVQEFCESYITR